MPSDRTSYSEITLDDEGSRQDILLFFRRRNGCESSIGNSVSAAFKFESFIRSFGGADGIFETEGREYFILWWKIQSFILSGKIFVFFFFFFRTFSQQWIRIRIDSANSDPFLVIELSYLLFIFVLSLFRLPPNVKIHAEKSDSVISVEPQYIHNLFTSFPSCINSRAHIQS